MSYGDRVADLLREQAERFFLNGIAPAGRGMFLGSMTLGTELYECLKVALLEDAGFSIFEDDEHRKVDHRVFALLLAAEVLENPA